MAGCCSTDYRRFFNRKFAARDLQRYRKRGLSATERDLVDLCGDVQPPVEPVNRGVTTEHDEVGVAIAGSRLGGNGPRGVHGVETFHLP